MGQKHVRKESESGHRISAGNTVILHLQSNELKLELLGTA